MVPNHDSNNINDYFRSLEAESKRRPLPSFIEAVQTEITPTMRGIVVDWLVDVAEEYELCSETLYLAVSYMDRKYEETRHPSVQDFCDITANSYSKKDVVMMESDILKFLSFEMGNPTINTFLRGFIMAGQDNSKYPNLMLEYMGSYLAELTLVDYSCVRFLPSVVAASAVFVARFTINPSTHPWSEMLQRETGYNPYELRDCIHTIHDLQLNRKRSRFTAISDKYKQNMFKRVSTLLPPIEIPSFYFEGF